MSNRSIAVAATVALGLAACGGGYSSPSSPSSAAGGNTGASGITITIASNAVAPTTINVPIGARVTFMNSDSRTHEMMSDPHPLHNDCPEINQVGMINPGQSKQTGALMTARACGFHDNLQDTNTALRGTILIGGAQDPGTHY